MREYIVVKTATDKNLQSFSRYLWQQKIPHRIVTENDEQLLLVGSEEAAIQVGTAYRHYLAGAESMPELGVKQEENTLLRVIVRMLAAPVTLVLLVLSWLGFALVELDPNYHYVSLFTFFDIETYGRFLSFSLPEGEYWRFITPIFLHFSWLHIVFNSMWLWDLGQRIERIQGSRRTLGIVMTIGLGSNIAQSLFAKVSVFGGMSGVIYGLLGYGWVWSAICPDRSVGIPKPVISFMLVWLVLCMLGVAELLGAGAVANAAHVGGLVIGLLLGAGAGLIARTTERA